MTSEQAAYVPNSGKHGLTNKNHEPVGLRPLTDKQEAYMEHYFDCNGSATCIAAKAGFDDVNNTAKIGKTKRIQIEIARCVQQKGAVHFMQQEFNVGKEDRLELLWMIARGGAERITDKEGNMVFMNPAVSVAAVRTINEMLPGSLAPKEVEITHKQDTRSEQDIRDNIAKLNAEYQSLVAIDGKVIKEKDVLAVTDLPAVSTDGKISKSKKTHV